jgi:TolB-like protein
MSEVPVNEDAELPSRPAPAAPHIPAAHAGHGLPIAVPFLELIKRRNVGRVAILYLVLGYLVLEVFSLFFHLLGMPKWIGQAMVAVVALGFPVALVFAWAYEITPEGLKPSHEVHPDHSIAHHTGRRLDRAIIAMLALALAYFVADKFWLSKRVTAIVVTTTAPAHPASSGVSEKSIAVLPFADMSEKKDQEYFADGLAEELLDLLAKTPGLHVIARTSSFSFKGKSDDIPTIAAKLKVANILEGSVRKSGNELRVNTELVRAADGEHMWSETYDREMKDIFKVQDEIAGAVVSALKLKLSTAPAASSSRSSNTDAYVQYMLGQQNSNRDSDDGYRQAIAAYHKAIALDAHYAAAYSGLAFSEYFLAIDTGDKAGVERAKAAAEQAVNIAPDQAMGLAVRGLLRFSVDWDWADAQADLAKALEIDPNNTFVLRRYADLQINLGHVSEAISSARKATDVDPFSAAAWQLRSYVLTCSGDLSGARDAARRSVAIDATDRLGFVNLAYVELMDRHPVDAMAAFQKITGDEPLWLSARQTGVAMAEHSLGHAKESDKALDEAIAKAGKVNPYDIAEAYAWRGEKDQAFAWLDQAQKQRDDGIKYIKSDPLLASLHSDPRFKAMLKKLNLPA